MKTVWGVTIAVLISFGIAISYAQTMSPPGPTGPAGPVNMVNALSYQTAAPAAAATVVMGNGIAVLYITSPLLALLTVTLPPSPLDGQLDRITAVNGITLMTVKDASGNTISASIGLGALGSSLWQYQNGSWVRLQ